VHPLILGLVQQFADPALIFADMAERLEMLEQSTHHARHGGHGFKYDSAVAVTL
jgi:hypothetical protein